MGVRRMKFVHVRIIIYIISIISIIFLINGKIITSCHWNDNYGFLCPTCGLTRATINIFRLNFKEALIYNFFYTCILFPFVAILVINDIYNIAKRLILKKDSISLVEILLGEAK